MDTSKLVILRNFSSVGEAIIYQSLLESNGIECQLLNETSADVFPIQGELTAIRLIVNEADVEQAEAILSAKFDQTEFDTESVKRRKKP